MHRWIKSNQKCIESNWVFPETPSYNEQCSNEQSMLGRICGTSVSTQEWKSERVMDEDTDRIDLQEAGKMN